MHNWYTEKNITRFKLSYNKLGEAIFARKENVMIPANYNALELKQCLVELRMVLTDYLEKK